jgi:hypothetical protein
MSSISSVLGYIGLCHILLLYSITELNKFLVTLEIFDGGPVDIVDPSYVTGLLCLSRSRGRETRALLCPLGRTESCRGMPCFPVAAVSRHVRRGASKSLAAVDRTIGAGDERGERESLVMPIGVTRGLLPWS